MHNIQLGSIMKLVHNYLIFINSFTTLYDMKPKRFGIKIETCLKSKIAHSKMTKTIYFTLQL